MSYYPALQKSVPFPASAGALFNGVSSQCTKSAAILTSNATGIMSFWIKLDGTVERILTTDVASGSQPITLQAVTEIGNPIRLTVGKVGVTRAATVSVSRTDFVSGWNHVLMSWDIDTEVASAYLNDVLATNESMGNFIGGNAAVPSDWYFCEDEDNADKSNISLSQFYYTEGTYLDLSVVANRRKFITDAVKPAYLGLDGSKPTGTQPLIYLNKNGGNFGDNTGSGGDFTEANLTTPTNTPARP